MKHISIEMRTAVVAKAKEGISQRQISIQMKISRCSVQNIIKKQDLFQNVENRPKCGRSKIFTDREQRLLCRTSLSNPFLTAPKLQLQLGKGSVTTVRRILKKNGLFGRVAANVPFLNKIQTRKRLNWATNYGAWTQFQWNNVIFSDESSIQLKPTLRVHVRRMNSYRHKKIYTLKTVKHGGKSLMVWGAIKANGERILIRFLKNADSVEYQRVLNEGLLSFLDNKSIFQQDGAPCHRSKSTQMYLSENGICYIDDWPPQSPDLNIIENMWSELKKNVYNHHSRNIDELWNNCLIEWNKIPTKYVKKLYFSLPSRMLCIRQNNGGNTHY